MSLEINPDWYFFKIASLPLFYNYKEDLISLTLPCPIKNIKKFIEVYQLGITYEELTNAIRKLDKKSKNKKNKTKLSEKEVNFDPITDEEKLNEFLVLSKTNRISYVYVEICKYKYGMNLNHQYIHHDDGTYSVSVFYRGKQLLEGPINNTKAEAKKDCIHEIIRKLCPTICDELYENNDIRHKITYGKCDFDECYDNNDNYENNENNENNNENYGYNENQDYNQNMENINENENAENEEKIENNNDIEIKEDFENYFEKNCDSDKDESEDKDIIDINNEGKRIQLNKLKEEDEEEEEDNINKYFNFNNFINETKKETQIDFKKEINSNQDYPIILNDNDNEITFNNNNQIILNDSKQSILLGSKRINDNEILFPNPKIKATTKIITLEDSSNSDSISGSDSTKSNNSNKKKLKEKKNLICGDEKIVNNFLDSFELKPFDIIKSIQNYFPNENIREYHEDENFILISKSVPVVSNKNKEQCANLFLSKIPMDINKKYKTIINLIKNKDFKHFFVNTK